MSQVNDKPSYWRSLAELENDPEFREAIEREFKVPLDQEPGSPARRRFMQVMGASFALTSMYSSMVGLVTKMSGGQSRRTVRSCTSLGALRYSSALALSGVLPL